MKYINIINTSTTVVIIIISLSIEEDNIVQFVAHTFSFLEQSIERSLLNNLMRRNSDFEKEVMTMVTVTDFYLHTGNENKKNSKCQLKLYSIQSLNSLANMMTESSEILQKRGKELR